jgi:hypothetical protein
MRFRFTASAVALSLLLGARSARSDSPVSDQWIVTAAHSTGAGGEQFISSFRIVNPNNFAATVDLYFLPQSLLDQTTHSALGDNSGAQKVTVTVGANQTLAIDDIIATKFNSAAIAGGVRVISNVPVSVLSQVLVANAKSATGVPGTNGFAIPGQTIDQAIAVGDVAYIPYVSSSDASFSTGYRTNIFLLSTLATGNTVVHVKLVKGDGTVIGERDYTLGKLSQTQINRIAAFEFGYTTPDTNLTAIITVKSGGPVMAGASIIDNAISSQSYAPPTKLWLATNGAYGLILNDGGYGFAGRLDIQTTTSTGATLPHFITAGVVLENCPGANPVQLFFVQGGSDPPFTNTTWTNHADGTYTMSGSSSTATWTGTIVDNLDGTIQGQIVYTRNAGLPSDQCPGGFKLMEFSGSRGTILSPL